MNQQAQNKKGNTLGNKDVEKIPQSSRSKKAKTTKEIMNRHISDEKDIITEEEFKNLKVIDARDTEHQPLEIENKEERPKDEDKDPKIVTPWDVIN